MPSAPPRCYVASPLGFNDAGRHYYAQVYLPALRQVVTPVDPWSLTTEEEVLAARVEGRQREMSLEVGRRNAEVESFIVESGGRICTSLDDLVAALGAAPVPLGASA